MPGKILIIEDEERLADHMRLWLEQIGYVCTWRSTGRSGLKTATEWQPDLVILDLALPEVDGWEVCRRLRQAGGVPIIMVTARGEEIDRVRGLKMGADDYVVKPFSLPELVARVEAVMRRTSESGRPPVLPYHRGRLEIDFEGHKVWVDLKEVRLTPTEFRLLAFFVRNEGRLLTHRQILHAVWGPEYGDDLDSLRMYVRSLRKKIGDPVGAAGELARHITTEYGVGYRFG